MELEIHNVGQDEDSTGIKRAVTNIFYEKPTPDTIFCGEKVENPNPNNPFFEPFTRSSISNGNKCAKDANRCIVLVLLGDARRKGMSGTLSLMYTLRTQIPT